MFNFCKIYKRMNVEIYNVRFAGRQYMYELCSPLHIIFYAIIYMYMYKIKNKNNKNEASIYVDSKKCRHLFDIW